MHILYAFALILYVAAGCAVWLVCLVLALAPTRRGVARRAALSMAATYPAVFLAQGLVTPVILVALGLGLLVVKLIDAKATIDSPFAIALTITLLLAGFAMVAAASLYGFYVGWMVTWRITGGEPRADALRAHRLLAWVMSWRPEWLGSDRPTV